MSLPSVQNLSDAKGYASSLITYYIPAKSDLWLVTSHLTSELRTADCVKDRKNSKYIKKAITYALAYLKSLRQLPPNGLALFAGEDWSYIWHER